MSPQHAQYTGKTGGNPRNAANTNRDRFVALAFCWADVVMELDDTGRVTFAAGAVERITKRSAGSLVGTPVFELFVEEDREAVRGLLKRVDRIGRVSTPSLRAIDGNDSGRPVQLSGYKIPEFPGRTFIALKQSDDGSRSASIAMRVDTDSGVLTGESFVDMVKHQVATGALDETRSVSVVAVPEAPALGVNLTEQQKTELINGIGQVLLASASPPGMAGRVADGRFALVHHSALNVDEMRGKLDEILLQIAPKAETGIVTATIPLDRTHLDDEQVADSLVFAINRFRAMSGRDFTLQSLRDQLSNLAEEAVTAISTLKQVIAGSDFILRFQPIVQTRTGVIHHYEALFRFPPHLNIGSPFEHVCLAEQTGLITDFDLAVTEKAIAWLSERVDEKSKLRIAVNVSGRSIVADPFVDALKRMLQANAWTRQHLMFEITESSRIDDLGRTNDVLQTFRKMGYAICLDDFGAGASNFNYLSKLEVDFVKLDGPAVHLAASGQRGGAFVSAFVQLCRRLRVAIIAEMIEDNDLLAFARFCGVPFVQGYLFGQPNEDITTFREADFRRKVSGERTLLFG